MRSIPFALLALGLAAGTAPAQDARSAADPESAALRSFDGGDAISILI